MKATLKDVRISWPHLFTAQANVNDDGTTTHKFSANFIFPKDAPFVKSVQEAMLATANDKWGANGAKVMAALPADKKCLRDGDNNLDKQGDVRNGFGGNAYIVCSSKVRPTVVDQARNPLAEQDGKPYGGCYVNAIIDIYAVDKGKVKGVFAELKGVQFVKDGERLGGSAAASADEFDDVSGESMNDLIGS